MNLYVNEGAYPQLSSNWAEGLLIAGLERGYRQIDVTDAIIYGTFTAATADATAGTITVTVEYIVRNSDGAANPTTFQN